MYILQNMKTFTVRSALSLSFVLLAAFSSAGAADTNSVTGTVRNETNHRLVAGVDVVLVRLENGMQEEERTKTDSRGRFALSLHSPEVPHLLRVVYQSVGYYQPVSGNQPIEFEVFNAATKVNGVGGKAEIMRIASNGKSLHVSDMYEIENASSPPITQAGYESFEFFLPAETKPDSVLAAAPGGMAVVTSAHRIGSSPGRWAVDFPLRPGATKFAVNYDLLYSGHAAFQPNIAYPMRQVAVMIPLNMKFLSDASGFHLLENESNEFQVEVINQARPGELPSFQVSGNGTLPPIGEKSQSRETTTTPGNVVMFKVTLGTDLIQSKMMPILVGFAGLVACLLLIWFRKATRGARIPGRLLRPISSHSSSEERVKQQLFDLEVARLRGSISSEEYALKKHCLEETIAQSC